MMVGGFIIEVRQVMNYSYKVIGGFGVFFLLIFLMMKESDVVSSVYANVKNVSNSNHQIEKAESKKSHGAVLGYELNPLPKQETETTSKIMLEELVPNDEQILANEVKIETSNLNEEGEKDLIFNSEKEEIIAFSEDVGLELSFSESEIMDITDEQLRQQAHDEMLSRQHNQLNRKVVERKENALYMADPEHRLANIKWLIANENDAAISALIDVASQTFDENRRVIVKALSNKIETSRQQEQIIFALTEYLSDWDPDIVLLAKSGLEKIVDDTPLEGNESSEHIH